MKRLRLVNVHQDRDAVWEYYTVLLRSIDRSLCLQLEQNEQANSRLTSYESWSHADIDQC